MDLGSKNGPNMESVYSSNHRPHISSTPVWSEKGKLAEDTEMQPPDANDDQASAHEAEVECCDGCNVGVCDTLQWDNRIGNLARSKMKVCNNNTCCSIDTADTAVEPSEEKGSDGLHALHQSGDVSPLQKVDASLLGSYEIASEHPTIPHINQRISVQSMPNGEILEESQELDLYNDYAIYNGNNPFCMQGNPVDTHSAQDGAENFTAYEKKHLEHMHSQEKEDALVPSLDQPTLKDSFFEINPVLRENMTVPRENPVLSPDSNRKGDIREVHPPGIAEDAEVDTSLRDSELPVITGGGKTPEPEKCIICGCPSRLANRFCTRKCIGRYATRTRIANQLALGGRKVKVARSLGRGRRRHHLTTSNVNNFPTVVHDQRSRKKNNLKMKIRWSSDCKQGEESSPGLPSEATGKKEPFRGTKGGMFSWSSYLAEQNAVAAPPEAFEHMTGRDPFPKDNPFRLGMVLEAVDPKHVALICPVFVAQVRGCRVRLGFCGYSAAHDFWTDVDNPLLFPCGFCDATGRTLQPPKGLTRRNFGWSDYMTKTKYKPAPDEIFSRPALKKDFPKFVVGQKLEAFEKRNPISLCVATVRDVIGDQILVHFDGWDRGFDYWCNARSQLLRPAGWCQRRGTAFCPPKDFSTSHAHELSQFCWDRYLKETGSTAADESMFSAREPSHLFENDMKLEVADPRNRVVVRVASISEIDGIKAKVHFDGWSDLYDFWTQLEDDNLHPAGWCERTGHPLEPNPFLQSGGCPTVGCTGVGHVQGARFRTHFSELGCPYSIQNLNRNYVKDRLTSHELKKSKRNSSILYGGGLDMESEPSILTAKAPAKKKNGDLYYSSSAADRKRARESLISGGRKLASQSAGAVSRWSFKDVAKFVKAITKDPTCGEIFVREEIDGRALLMLAKSDLHGTLNIKLGPAVKIYDAISNIRGKAA